MAAASRSRKRREEHDEEEHASERWLVTYADMLTLLMVLFIILFAMSTVDVTKYQQLKDGLMSAFGHSILGGQEPTAAQGQDSGGSQATSIMDLTPQEQQAVSTEVTKQASQRTQREYAEAKTEVTSLIKAWEQMKHALQQKGLQDDVRATIDQRGLVVSLVSRHVVFEPNLATLSARGEAIVDAIAPVLAQLPQPIEIDGHTNQVKVKPKYFASDWDLSAARAITVLRRLQDRDGLPANRLSETGFGHTKPLIDPAEPGSQAINKRVDVVVLSQASAEAKAHFQEVLQALHATHGGSL